MVKETNFAKTIRQFLIAGRRLPTEQDPTPTVYRMRVFGPTETHAKSRFWYYLRRMNKTKKSAGEIVSVKEVFEKKKDHLKTYGILIRLEAESGTHNMYREYRDISLNCAVSKLITDMAGRYAAKPSAIHVVSTGVVTTQDKMKRPLTLQFAKPGVRFPLVN
jgi:large subunit ribosomal protein L18Ae